MNDDAGAARLSPTPAIVIALPFTGRWLVRNSPARRVPSHGVDLFGERYAIDFIGVDDRGRSSGRRDWRTFLGTEPADRFVGFGRPILAPVDGVVVEVHDGEMDHVARRSQLALLPYALGQAARIRHGADAIAGNRVIIAPAETGGVFAVLAHLRAGSVRVAVGQKVTVGQIVAGCGNSGNSTQPHLHVQLMDSLNLSVTQGVPMAFRQFRERPRGKKQFRVRERAVPDEGAVVEPIRTDEDR